MPWIHVTLSQRVEDADRLAAELAVAAAAATNLGPAEVVVLVTVADASSGSGAVVTIAGRRRGKTAETDLTAAVRRVVAAWTGLGGDLIAVVRS